MRAKRSWMPWCRSVTDEREDGVVQGIHGHGAVTLRLHAELALVALRARDARLAARDAEVARRAGLGQGQLGLPGEGPEDGEDGLVGVAAARLVSPTSRTQTDTKAQRTRQNSSGPGWTYSR